MEFTIDEMHTKKLLKEVVLELMKEQQDVFVEIIKEVFEEIGLAEAIRKGRKNDFISESEIFVSRKRSG